LSESPPQAPKIAITANIVVVCHVGMRRAGPNCSRIIVSP
jgi:hypothetical protein